ncbi:MAG TPA: ion channel [bacterium]|nr:ion channel [bacterium]HOL48032.1 ion channel [bacterium]HPQ19136.1 ion channel [bacterium]
MNKREKETKAIKIKKQIKNWLKLIKFFIVSNQDIKILVSGIIFILLVGFLFLTLEKKYNDGYGSFLDSVYWTVVSVTTVGYGDISPKTATGRFLTIFILFIGVALVGVITGKITSFLVERRLKEGRGLGEIEHLKNHFIICGWCDNMANFLIEILKVNNEFTSDQLVLINTHSQDEIAELKNIPELRYLHFIYGDFVEENVLKRANIKNASRIMVLADTAMANSIQEVDARTVMAIMTIDSLNKNIYSCAEILDPKFKKHLEISHCNEIILSRNYSRMLLTNATTASGISHVVSHILDVDSSARMISVDFPDSFISKTFAELKAYFESLDGSILIGILENAGNVFQQKREALKEAQKTPDISKLVSNLKNIKEIISNKPVINPGPNYIIKKHSKAIIVEPSYIT